MKKFSLFKIVPLILGLFLAVACFDKEPQEREKFIDFLNSHYIKEPAGSVAELNDQVTKDIGRYVEHHQALTFYNYEAKKTLEPGLEKIVGAIKPLDYGNIPEAIDFMKKNKEDLAAFLAENEAIYEKALAKKEALKMPDDLKELYDQAFDKAVVTSYEAIKKIYGQPMNDVFDARIALLEFMEANKDKIAVTGANRLEILDPSIQTELQTLLNDSNTKGKALQALSRELRAEARSK
ncbi:hypothetical protein C4J81_09300 [Deltaproteobacteria bacterium Smac51]|nr:hypothetical protein C4J81_09300 [Deltaproteobacteria bacterium Smac51]